ncbi:MAG: hypothetical protein FWG94_09830 [Oscillospiraceae bacterium]|nr:hypothetical protein [Oscillospiraceae bacterium]
MKTHSRIAGILCVCFAFVYICSAVLAASTAVSLSNHDCHDGYDEQGEPCALCLEIFNITNKTKRLHEPPPISSVPVSVQSMAELFVIADISAGIRTPVVLKVQMIN